MLLQDRSVHNLPGLVVCTYTGLQRTDCRNALIQDKSPNLASEWQDSHCVFVIFSLPLRLVKPGVRDKTAIAESWPHCLSFTPQEPKYLNSETLLLCICTFWSIYFDIVSHLGFEAKSGNDGKSIRERYNLTVCQILWLRLDQNQREVLLIYFFRASQY